LTALGIVGIFISFAGEQSDYVDPTTFGIAVVSILIAIIGLAIVFKSPTADKGLRT
jgi:hypothetical protein